MEKYYKGYRGITFFNALVRWLKELPNDKIKDSETGVLAHTNNQVKDIQKHLSNAGVDSLILTSDKADDQTNTGIRLCTMHRAKGLEFKAVAIPFMSNPLFPPKWLLDKAVDDADQEDTEGQLKALLHVAAT